MQPHYLDISIGTLANLQLLQAQGSAIEDCGLQACVSSFGMFLESCRLSVSVLPWNSLSAAPSPHVTQ